jgi:predicted molibdopterin-dependent oxidoreductase YjgC
VVGTGNVDMLARLKVPKGLNTTFFSGELNRMAEHEVILILDKNVGEINPLTGIEIVRAVNKKDRKLILVNDEFNKFNKIATVVLPAGIDQALEELRKALSSSAGSDAAKQAAALLKNAKSIAIIVPARLSDKELAGIRDLGGQLKNVTWYPLVRRSNFQGALDMGIVSGYLPGYRKAEKPGMNAVEMIDAIRTGKLASLYIMGDDPAGSDPGLKQALEKLEFLVVQDIFMTETAKLAHVVLPAAASAEKSGTFTNLERRLQQLNRAEEPVGEARPDWEIIQDIAQRMGGTMHYGSVRDIMKEIRSVVPMYADLALGACWPREQSPLAGMADDLSLASDSIMKQEVITAERLLFSSGMSITRSHEIGTIRHYKIEV